MKVKVVTGVLATVLLVVLLAAGCTSSYATSDQVMSLQSQVNSLSSQLNTAQQQLASSQQQLTSAQQALTQAQSSASQQNTYTTYAQPAYPRIIYFSNRYSTGWNFWQPRPIPPAPPPFPHHTP